MFRQEHNIAGKNDTMDFGPAMTSR